MSAASDKGRSLEELVEKTLQKKLGARVQRDKRSGAGSHQKMDIKDYYQDTPFDIEVKNHQAVKIKEWFRQAKAGASMSRIPAVVFKSDDDVLAALPFADLVDLVAENKQLRAEAVSLRAPVVPAGLDKAIASKASQGAQECRNGHIIPWGATRCLIKGCPYSSGYKAKKDRK